MIRITGAGFSARILLETASRDPFWNTPERRGALGVFAFFPQGVKNAPDSSWEGARFSLSGASSSPFGQGARQ